MKAAHFDYHAPTTIDETVSLLRDHADDVKVLAGGQSLVPILALRLARFAHLVDVNRVDGLADISTNGGGLRIGATTRQSVAEHSEAVARLAPLVARALPFVGHFQIRNRGTVGGSLAHADPASELPCVATALDGELEARGPNGTRRIPATEFFTGLWETALRPDELLVALHLPALPARSGVGFEELAWRLGDFAIAGAACALTLDDAGRIARAGVALMGMGTTPMRARAVEQALVGSAANEFDTAPLRELALEGTSPVDDVHASADYRRKVIGPIVERVTAHALKEASRG